ncbi:endocytic trafficking protein [Schizosaccharomyces osmophilus]|uniref:Endocytic trafficking protein n=1 Tax=Schizosaccharomyces osmophilus TaxID=2545709 RepID=A0AAF0AUF3_9SCHI|nr:endocytic trafficking protein [Schizosaccharomyces osmophilus]WBW72436.1 endocytic trafficking protein [Schizosaccharomyces osmophilus]
MSIENNYILRQVSESDRKACFICYKLTKWVLITKSKSDFFYTCFNHLEDRGFATSTYDPHEKPASSPKTDESFTSSKKDHDSKEKSSNDDLGKDHLDKSEENHESSKTKTNSNSNSNIPTKERDVDLKEARSSPSTSSSISSGTTMSGRQYVLHRNIFEIRLQFHKNLAAQRKTKLLLNSGKGLPSPPSKPLP